MDGGLRSLPTCTLAPHEASPCHLNLHHCQHLCHAWSEDSEHQSIGSQFALSSHAHNLGLKDIHSKFHTYFVDSINAQLHKAHAT